MSLHYQTETVQVRGKSLPLHLVAVVCDTCGGQHVKVTPWQPDTEKALDEAEHACGFEIADDANRTTLCGACVDLRKATAEAKGA